MTDAVDLVRAAAAASGVAPADPAERSRWMAGVAELAVDLFRQAQMVVEPEIALLEKCQPIPGIIVAVEEHSGRGLITFHPLIGDSAGDPDATEQLRTAFLNEAKGAALFAQAKSLVGWRCSFGRWYDEVADGKNKGRRIRMCAWIDAVSPPAEAEAAPARSHMPANGASENRVSPDGTFEHPFSTQVELVRAARERFGIEMDDVRREANSVLGPLRAIGRTPAELTQLWTHLCKQFEAASRVRA